MILRRHEQMILSKSCDALALASARGGRNGLEMVELAEARLSEDNETEISQLRKLRYARDDEQEVA